MRGVKLTGMLAPDTSRMGCVTPGVFKGSQVWRRELGETRYLRYPCDATGGGFRKRNTAIREALERAATWAKAEFQVGVAEHLAF